MAKEIEIPEGYEARIEGNKVILEPKESEDERIRWYVTLVVKDWWNKIAEVTDDGKWPTEEEMLAYLEKQKERSPFISAEESLGISQEEYNKIVHECIFDERKEQKPIPKFKVGDRIYDKRDSYNRNVIREVGKDYYINAFAQKMDMAYTDANFEFIEHLDDDPIVSKPAEWSEEDEKALNRAINICKNDFGENSETARFLKSLPERFNLQPKQEWSEEDSKYASYVCAAIDCYYMLREERNNHNGQEELDAAKNWLKNRLKTLRPRPNSLSWQSGHPKSHKSVLILRHGDVVVEGEWNEETGRWYQYGFQSYFEDNEVIGWVEKKSLLSNTINPQPEVDLEKLGGIARHLIAVKGHEEDMRLDEGEWLLLERIGYPERFSAKKEEQI